MSVDIPFERYDDEFSNLLTQIATAIKEDPPSSLTKNLLQQADDLVKQMAVEARSQSDAVQKRELLSKVRSQKAELSKLQSTFDKQSLLLNGGSDRDGLMKQQTEDMLTVQNDRLERARRTMEETEAVALEITDELGHNRETLMSSHNRVREVSSMTGRARRILTTMNQRHMQQKLVMYGVAAGLVLGFLLLLYAMWR